MCKEKERISLLFRRFLLHFSASELSGLCLDFSGMSVLCLTKVILVGKRVSVSDLCLSFGYSDRNHKLRGVLSDPGAGGRQEGGWHGYTEEGADSAPR